MPDNRYKHAGGVFCMHGNHASECRYCIIADSVAMHIKVMNMAAVNSDLDRLRGTVDELRSHITDLSARVERLESPVHASITPDNDDAAEIARLRESCEFFQREIDELRRRPLRATADRLAEERNKAMDQRDLALKDLDTARFARDVALAKLAEISEKVGDH